jgi:hypothetical protein
MHAEPTLLASDPSIECMRLPPNMPNPLPPAHRDDHNRVHVFMCALCHVAAFLHVQAVITAELTPIASDLSVKLDMRTRAVKVAVNSQCGSECNQSTPSHTCFVLVAVIFAAAPDVPHLHLCCARLPAMCQYLAAGSTTNVTKWSNTNRSTCGDAGLMCDVGFRCFDGMNCCPLDTPVCGGFCCAKPWLCMQNRCVPPGSTPCDKYTCDEGYACLESNLCCRPTDSVCNHQCCTKGKHCRANMCVEEDSLPCGLRMCQLPSEFCADQQRGMC